MGAGEIGLHAHVVVAWYFRVANILLSNNSEVTTIDVASTVERRDVLRLNTGVDVGRTVDQCRSGWHFNVANVL